MGLATLSESAIRLLLLLPQMPHDPASGAARSLRVIAEILAGAGFAVRALGITATERAQKQDAGTYLREAGFRLAVERRKSAARNRPELSFESRGVRHRLLDAGNRALDNWERTCGAQFDLMLEDELRDFRPDAVLTYGGSVEHVRRMKRARARGAKVVFGLRNHGYYQPGFFDCADAVLTCSEYLTRAYRERIGLESVAIPSPIDLEETVAVEREPIFFTLINPSAEKGLMFSARLCEEAARRRPDMALLVVESRGIAGQLVRAGLDAGFDLRRHENIMMAPAVPFPRDIYGPAKVLLAPSLWQEPLGRVSMEAQINGVPPIVSDRGGLPETCAEAGFVVPIAASIGPECAGAVEAAEVEPWLELMMRLEDDEAFYRAEAEKARMAGQRFTTAALSPRYVEFFRRVVDG